MWIKSKKRPAPRFIPYLCALLYVVIAVCVIACIVTHLLWLLTIAGVVILCLFIISKLFSWYLHAELSKKGGKILYEITDIVDMMGSSKTTYHLQEVTSLTKKGTKGYLVGTFSLKEPFKKPTTVKKMIIQDISDEAIIFIKEEFSL